MKPIVRESPKDIRKSADTLAEWLRKHSSAFLGELSGEAPQVVNTGGIYRPSASLHRFELRSGQVCQRILIKERPPSVAARYQPPEGDWALFVGASWPPPAFMGEMVVTVAGGIRSG